MLINKKIQLLCLIGTICFALLAPGKDNSTDLLIKGRIESLRKHATATVIMKKKPASRDYHIISGEKIIGKISLISITSLKNSYRIIVDYTITDAAFNNYLKVGQQIALLENKKKWKSPKKGFIEKKIYSQTINSPIDNRSMTFIPAGSFIMGSNIYLKMQNNEFMDEYPEHSVSVNGFYIDMFEVSNKDYKKYVNATFSKPPLSWKNGIYNPANKDLPVLVTYYEACTYAKWARKRLPTEIEWEKAAQINESKKPRIYPWGDTFSPYKANCKEFWEIPIHNEKYRPGLMPVSGFKTGASFYNVYNMSGNAREWTASWYMPHPGNTHTNRYYGKQYKVIKGGSWFNNRFEIRSSSRFIGGLPNLVEDNIAGFRCVKDVSIIDRKKNAARK